MDAMMQPRRDTAATWAATNPVLAQGEAGLDLDIGLVKVGDGITAWISLPYAYAGFYQSPGPADGMNPVRLPHWRKAMGALRQGTASAKLLCVGDSTTWGAHANGGTNDTLSSYPQRLASMLNSYHAPAGVTFAVGQSYFSADVDSRWAYGTSVIRGGLGFGNGSSVNCPVGAGNTTFTPGYSCDTFDVYYIDYGNGAAQVSIDAGPATAITGAATNTIKKITLTAAAGSSHVVNIGTVTLNTVFIVGIDAYLSTSKQIRIGNAGVSGSAATHWATVNPNFSPADCIRAWAPDLTIVMLGINDALGSSRTVAQYHADMLVTINAALASGDVILCSVIPSSDANGSALESSYRLDMRQWAAANGVPFMDVWGRFGSYAVANSAGLMFDLVHPNGAGYADVAAAFYGALRAVA